MRTKRVGDSIILIGILLILISVAGLATDQPAPMDLEKVAWAGSIVATVGIILILVGR